MMNREALFQFICEQAALQPAEKRIEIYRAVAELFTEQADREKLLELIEGLERTEAQYQDFIRKLSQRV